ncbi:hypothetical protein ES703_113547 [subsurface metagenome]
MNGVVRERNWYDWVLPGMRLFGLEGGRVKSRTAQIVLTLVSVAGVAIMRSVRIYLAPPWIFLDPCAIFLYFPALSLPWLATLPIIVTGGALGGNQLASTIGIGTAVQLVYFSSRFLENRGWGKYRLLAIAFGSFIGTFIGAASYAAMGLLPLEIGAPLVFFRSLISVGLCLAIVPVIWRFLRKRGLI